MKKYILYTWSLLLFALSSCEEVIDYELQTADSKLVVEGLITDQPGPYYVRLSNTTGYLTEGKTPGVNGAYVEIRDSKGTVELLEPAGDGLYKTTSLQGKINTTYFLIVRLNGEEYHAQTTLLPVSPIQKLTFDNKKAQDEEEGDYRPHLHFSDPAGKGNFYRWRVQVNGTEKPDELAVFNDEIYDGKSGDVDMHFGLHKGDKLKVELLSLDKPAYKFWFAIVNQQNATGGPFETTPANAPGNVSNGALGFFGASAVSVVEGVVE